MKLLDGARANSTVAPWLHAQPLQPVVDLEEQAVVQGSTLETRTGSAKLLLKKKKQAFLCKSSLH